ncbi:STAS domain-containing protein [Nonomuraea sp. 3N208]|uniref:STAS domain-containing protein n=1 Tax=Nonomuraea sp. 3N208 TaxID=3457421 RepID=UPI003FD3F4C0
MTTLHPRSGAGLWLIPATATVVRLCGELDIGTGEAVRERLLRALRYSTSLLILDLSGVSFCDAAGLGAVVGVQHRARSLDIALGLAAPVHTWPGCCASPAWTAASRCMAPPRAEASAGVRARVRAGVRAGSCSAPRQRAETSCAHVWSRRRCQQDDRRATPLSSR